MYSSEEENAPLQKVADAFTAETGIKVKLDFKSSAGGYRQWMLTQMASGRSPDIMMSSRDWADNDALNDYIYDLTDAFGTPNEYYEDKTLEKWSDTFTEAAMKYSSSAFNPGHYYIVPLTLVSVRIMINLDYLDEHGIARPRRDWTWNEYMDICEKVKATGMPVFECANARAVDGPAGWAIDVMSNMLMPDIINELDEDGNRSINCNEMIKAVLEGKLDYTSDRVLEVFDYIDQWKQYWSPAFNSTDMETALHTFFKQESWSYMNGSWSSIGMEKVLDNAYGDAHTYVRFNYTAMPFPRLTTENSPHCVYDKIPEIGDVGYAFVVSKAAEKRGQADNAVKFLKYLQTVKQISSLFEENWNIAAIKGVELNDRIKEFDWVDNSEAYVLRVGGATLPDTSAGSKYFNQLQLYLKGEINRAEFGSRVQKAFLKTSKDISEQYGWDKSNNYGIL